MRLFNVTNDIGTISKYGDTYYLMHLNHKVLEFKVTSNFDSVYKITNVINKDRVPIGCYKSDGSLPKSSLFQWFKFRSIEKDRVVPKMNIFKEVIRIGAASISDCYWVKPIEAGTTWEDINFHDNDFAYSSKLNIKELSWDSICQTKPTGSTNGCLKKHWILDGDKRVLVKGTSDSNMQEPFNEVFASRVCLLLSLDYVPYYCRFERNLPFSLCESFTSDNLEYIPAWYISSMVKQLNSVSDYEHYISVCESLGVMDIRDKVEDMIVVDYLIGNTDRHWGNFGLLRDPVTLEYVSVAPIFDCGNSLFYNVNSRVINTESETKSKSFKKTNEDCLELVRDYTVYDSRRIREILNIFDDVVKELGYLEESRINVLREFLQNKIVHITR